MSDSNILIPNTSSRSSNTSRSSIPSSHISPVISNILPRLNQPCVRMGPQPVQTNTTLSHKTGRDAIYVETVLSGGSRRRASHHAPLLLVRRLKGINTCAVVAVIARIVEGTMMIPVATASWIVVRRRIVWSPGPAVGVGAYRHERGMGPRVADQAIWGHVGLLAAGDQNVLMEGVSVRR